MFGNSERDSVRLTQNPLVIGIPILDILFVSELKVPREEHSSYNKSLSKSASRYCSTAFDACAAIAPKLKVSHPNDSAEKEADRIADEIMKVPDTYSTVSNIANMDEPQVQRKCASCERKERDVEKHARIHIQNEMNGSKGKPLDSPVKSFMERRFFHDFSNVSVHTDTISHQLNKDLSARAFTAGTDIFFASEEYSPHSITGRHLLAHELAHVVQQVAGPYTLIQRYDAAPNYGMGERSLSEQIGEPKPMGAIPVQAPEPEGVGPVAL